MNRVLAHTGARYPIVPAPMGHIARSALAAAGMAASLARAGQTVGLIHEALSVAEIIRRTVEGFHEIRMAQAERSARGDF